MSPSKNQSENLSFISASKVKRSFHDLLLFMPTITVERMVEAAMAEQGYFVSATPLMTNFSLYKEENGCTKLAKSLTKISGRAERDRKLVQHVTF